MNESDLLWKPSQASIDAANMTRFIEQINQNHGLAIDDYDALYQWSIENKEAFWSETWDFCGIIGDKGERILVDGENIEKAQWFPDATLNFAENLLRKRNSDVAIYFRAEDQVEYSLTYQELYDQVASVAAWLKSNGLEAGDRVAAYLPNMPETVVAMLAATSLGAVWTSTSPDFGEDSVVDRFGQTEPRFLFTVDGYFYNGKRHEISDKIRNICAQLPSVEQLIQVNLAGFGNQVGAVDWKNIIDNPVDQIEFVACNFNDPLYVLYSSGTTGKPKCITHKVGGTLIQHLKEQMLHCDIHPGDRVFYFTTLGWMMWNWLVSALASQATLVLYDGSPFYPDGEVLWRYAEEIDLNIFGTSAKYIDAMKNAKLRPMDKFDLSALRTIASTGSVLAPESFDYVYENIKQDVCLASVSGGTDIVSCFVISCPLLPVYRGEIQCRGLGLAVDVFDDDGNPVRNQKGELVCTQTFPSQPVYFWADESGEKYHNAYFARFDNVWHHGDYVMLTDHNGIIVFGRSDATLNPGGVRIGTAEIYRHVEQLDEVVESIVIGQQWQDDVRVVLFVVLQPGINLDAALEDRIRRLVRTKCTPRHVPAKIVQVAEIPRTKSGKIVELAVREVVHDRPVKNIHSLANPEALELYRSLPQLQD
ncbi:MAG: acetoacetate--CoA ligase [Gammaproteobacteria bacterium]|nr:acetoacetate--CoA ligase [Gammaproteobacteria bacterium]MDH3857232.1 acetoacetate--CoA ligase [Gammaproteobacteria bacterium]